MYNKTSLSDMLISELREVATGLSVPGADSLNKSELISGILKQQELLEQINSGASDQVAEGDEAPKKRRGRKKKEDAPAVSEERMLDTSSESLLDDIDFSKETV